MGCMVATTQEDFRRKVIDQFANDTTYIYNKYYLAFVEKVETE
jgi:hypothetical protein